MSDLVQMLRKQTKLHRLGGAVQLGYVFLNAANRIEKLEEENRKLILARNEKGELNAQLKSQVLKLETLINSHHKVVESNLLRVILQHENTIDQLRSDYNDSMESNGGSC